METVAVRWNVELETWLVSPLLVNPTGQQSSCVWLAFDEWASQKDDSVRMRFILQGENYVCRWLTLPGVQGRHLSKAIPFAIEEALIEDIRHYHLVTAGKRGKFTHRIYCTLSDQIHRFLDACNLHHIIPEELTPETSLIPENTLIHKGDYWLINVAGLTESKIHETALPGFLESLCNDLDAGTEQSITIIDDSLDSANLLKTQIDSSFAGVFQSVTVQQGGYDEFIKQSLNSKCLNLLTNQFQPAEARVKKPSAWWKPVAALAACWCFLSIFHIKIENNELIEKQEYVRAETISLYKQLFPGERIRFLERQVRNKIKGDDTAAVAGVLVILSEASKALNQDNLKQNIAWQRFSFNDRQNQLTIELTAKTLGQLQNYKAALESQGLMVEISQATNDDNGVKGRLKIGSTI